MDILSLFGAIGSAVSGGFLGLFGTGVKMYADHKAQQAKQLFQLKMRELDQAEMTLEHQLHMKEVEAEANRDIAVATQNRLSTEAQAQADIEQAEIQLIQRSHESDRASYGGGFVDAIRGLMRPTLTLYFAVLMALIAYQLFSISNEMIGGVTAQNMLIEVINACIFLATTSVTWWFGSRPIKRGQ